MNQIIRMINNKEGKLRGYGGCQECGDTWNWKKEQSISYNKSSGMFPLCKECFKKMLQRKIEEHCIALMVEWGENESEIKEVLPEIKKNIRDLKKTAQGGEEWINKLKKKLRFV